MSGNELVKVNEINSKFRVILISAHENKKTISLNSNL